MLKFLLSPEAVIDLEKIFDYTLMNWSSNQAVKYQNELNEAFHQLAAKPSLGKQYLFKSGNYRKFKVNRHLLFYQHNDTNCIIVRILHEQMDIKSHL
jgi:toxin ParE1/3/4